MTRRRVQLNVSKARVLMLPLRAVPEEILVSQLAQQGESIAAGGSEFSHNRQMRGASTVHDALPADAGFHSVEYVNTYPAELSGKKHFTQLRACKSSNCGSSAGASEPFTALYDEAEFVGIAQLPEGTLAWKREGGASLGGRPVVLKGIFQDSCMWTSVVQAGGRLVASTKDMLYWSGIEDNLDFTPSLSTGAASTGHVFNIGSIVKLIPSPEGFYALGTNGALHAQCTGDLEFPYNFREVLGFRGIKRGRWCVVQKVLSEYLAYTTGGLQLIKGLEAQDVEPELSHALCQGVHTVLNTVEAEEPMYQCGHEFRDNFDCKPAVLAEERPFDNEAVRVVNICDRYTSVSYGARDLQDYYTQMYILDSQLARSGILNIEHTDMCWNDKHNTLEVASRERSFAVTTDCTGTEHSAAKMFFNDFHSLMRSVQTVTKAVLFGHFCQSDYVDAGLAVTGKHYLQHIPISQGVDVRGSHVNLRGLSLTFASRGEVQYAGRVRQHNLGFVIPFNGYVSGVFLDI